MDAQAEVPYRESVHEAPASIARPARPRPADVVGEHHVWVDGELMAWGRWTRSRETAVKCGSAEGQYRAPWRQWHYPSVEELMPKPIDNWIWRVDRGVTAQADLHRTALTLHYARLFNPYVTCRKLRARYEHFAPIMEAARAGVLKFLRA